MTDLPPENVQSYPRPPLLERVLLPIRVIVAGQVLAETQGGWRVCETHHPPSYYLPPEDVVPGALTPVRRQSWCEWKGRAVYFDLTWQGRHVPQAAWSYPDPTPRFAPIAGYVAIYATAVDEAWVGQTRVEPQPGDFYGGWVTPNLTGRIKGPPGTEGW